MIKWYVYILQCSDNSFYCGATNSIKERVRKHNLGKGSKYTRSRLPVFLLKFWEFENKSEAYKEEYRIKQLNRKQKEELIK